MPDERYFSIPSAEVGGDVRRNRALNCWPCVRSLTHSPDAVIHSPAARVAACPTTVTMTTRLGPQNAKPVLSVVAGYALDETGNNFLRPDSRMGVSYVKQPRCGPRCRSVQRNGYFASHLRGEYALDRSWTRVSVSVQSAGPPSGCRRAECGNRELVPLCRVIHARCRSRQHRSQETSVRALRRVAHQDGLARVKTTYVFCVR